MSLKKRAIHINNTLGTRVAAGYCRNQGVTLRLALFLLVGQTKVRAS